MSSARHGEVSNEFVKETLGLSEAQFEGIRHDAGLMERLAAAAIELIYYSKEAELEKARRRAYEERLAAVETNLTDAETDEVTGLLNRKAFLRSVRDLDLSQGYLAVMMDIRGLKAVNDKFGHGAGDLMLAGTARALIQKGVRTGSLVGRWGGDEFAMAIPVDEQSDSDAIMKRLRGLFDGTETAELCNIGGGKGVYLSARFGYSAVDDPSPTAFETALEQADLIMVKAAEAEDVRGVLPPLVERDRI